MKEAAAMTPRLTFLLHWSIPWLPQGPGSGNPQFRKPSAP
jgi:hypothetical protein